jgi:hypothetical protein
MGTDSGTDFGDENYGRRWLYTSTYTERHLILLDINSITATATATFRLNKAAGICAHELALQGGAEVKIPRFDL